MPEASASGQSGDIPQLQLDTGQLSFDFSETWSGASHHIANASDQIGNTPAAIAIVSQTVGDRHIAVAFLNPPEYLRQI